MRESKTGRERERARMERGREGKEGKGGKGERGRKRERERERGREGEREEVGEEEGEGEREGGRGDHAAGSVDEDARLGAQTLSQYRTNTLCLDFGSPHALSQYRTPHTPGLLRLRSLTRPPSLIRCLARPPSLSHSIHAVSCPPNASLRTPHRLAGPSRIASTPCYARSVPWTG
eukprot:1849252-Rhodomonas_salina.1